MASSVQPQNKCSKCGTIFETLEGARQHERNCSGKDRAAGNPAVEGHEQTTEDMEIEEGFEATDN